MGSRGPRGLKNRVQKWIAGVNYTGDQNASVTPWGALNVSSTPGPGVAPVITIPIDDDEALSTVMKLVKAALPDGSNLAGYARELDRS